MGTHAMLGLKMPDDSIVGCYVHYDGATMSARINRYLSKYTTTNLAMLILTAQGHGGIRSFHTPDWRTEDPKDSSTEMLDDPDGPLVIDNTNWDEWHYGASYKYLINYETGKISKRSRQ